MTKPSKKTEGGGIGGVLFLCSAAVAAAGITADFLAHDDPAFWLGAQDGGAAAMGAGAAAFAVFSAYVARALLARSAKSSAAREKRRADTDA